MSGRRNRDLEEEIQQHLRFAAQEGIARGDAPDDTALRREFGNIALIQEITREMWGWTSLERLWRDTRYSLRSLRQSPGFALTAVLSLGLGIGANTASFSLADALILRPPAITNPAQVLAINANSPRNPFDGVSYPDFDDIRRLNQSFDSVTGFTLRRLAVARSTDAVPQMRMGMAVTAGFFQALGVQPAFGRAFDPDEDSVWGKDGAVVLSHSFWTTQLAADPAAIGSVLRFNGLPFTIVGVAPPDFKGMNDLLQPAFYFPLTMADRLSASPDGGLRERRGAAAINLRARLKPGVTKAMAQAELTSLANSLERSFPATNRDRTFTARTDFEARVREFPANAIVAAMLLSLTALVLLIACANVASLLLARARSRSREIAIRLAIGAGRGRLLQQLLTESLVLAIWGGLAGVAVANGAIRYLAAIQLPTDTPLVIAVQLDQRVLFFAMSAAVVSALVFGLIPAWKTVQPNLTSALKSGDLAAAGPRRLSGRNLLVTVQVALSLVLLVASGALLDAFRRMLILNPGIRTDHLLMMEFDPSMVRYTPDQTREFFRVLADRARSLPGVRSAALSRAIPFRPNFSDEEVIPEGYQFPRGQRSVSVSTNVIDEQYFKTMRTEILRGRGFTVADTAQSRPVAVINDEFARRYWPGQDAVGKRFRLGITGPMLEVAGVARTGKYLQLAEAPQPYVYLPLSQNLRTRMTLFVETAGEPQSMAGPLLQLVRTLDANQPVFNVRSFQTYYDQGALGVPLIVMQMAGSTGAGGLVLAVVGLYGLVAYSVSRRTREIGIRMAIGADRMAVLRLVLRQGFLLSLTGSAAGLALSIPIYRMMAAGLAGLGTLSPWTLVIVPLGLIATTTLACYVPAYRASRIDPLIALRYE
jgi:macrolide transport system ATP-binding/permease protein